jgi:hypothetical protein
MQMYPMLEADLIRLRQRDLERHAERSHREHAVATAPSTLARRVVLAAVAAIPVIVAIASAAPRINFR